MTFEFVIRAWAAWAPDITEQARWLAWAAEGRPSCPRADGSAPALAAMPAMSRRRLNPLGRMAAQVAYDLAGPGTDEAASAPMLYASRYGDAGRSLALLAELARGEPISPTAFGLSVHNAIGAMVSIARGDRSHHSALAGGATSAGAALIEASGLLADGEREVIVVHYDAPLPGDYAAFADESPAAYAWAWKVALPAAGEPRLRLELVPEALEPTDSELPFGLGLLRFGLSADAHWETRADGQRWSWSRRDA